MLTVRPASQNMWIFMNLARTRFSGIRRGVVFKAYISGNLHHVDVLFLIFFIFIFSLSPFFLIILSHFQYWCSLLCLCLSLFLCFSLSLSLSLPVSLSIYPSIDSPHYVPLSKTKDRSKKYIYVSLSFSVSLCLCLSLSPPLSIFPSIDSPHYSPLSRTNNERKARIRTNEKVLFQ